MKLARLRFIGVFDFVEDASGVSTAMSRGDLEYGHQRYD